MIQAKLHMLLSRLNGVKREGHDKYVALCPAHDDHNHSLSLCISDDGKKILLHCFAGCDTKAILAAIGLTQADLVAEGSNEKPGVVKEINYQYCDADGSLLYTKVRTNYTDGTKKFYFVQPDGKTGVKGIKHVPYNLPNVCQAEIIYFVEGEKCAQALMERGYAATTLATGSSSKWLPEYAPYFEGKKVIIIPDNDEPGRKYARMLKQNIPHAIIKELPGLKKKEDIYDWLASGHTMDELDALPEAHLAEETAPEEHQKERKEERDTTQAGALLDLFQQSGAKMFLNETSDLYAALPVGSHSEIVAVESRSFSGWLHRLYYQQTKHPIRQEAVTQAISILSADAIYAEQEKVHLYNRVAAHQNAIWYDLTNPTRQAVKVSADGWTVEDTPPILFYRYRHQNPQVLPQRGGNIKRVFRYVNVKRFQLLFLCWLVSCFVPDIPHPMPILYGEKGAAKSTACVLLKRLIDPSASDTLPLHNDSRNLVVNLQQHWFLPFDNVSNISGDTSDMLCRAITGGSIQQRKLYTDAEDVIFNFMRCLTVNGISNAANRSDLLDRSILLELERVPETERKELTEVYRQFEEDRAAILGGIFDALSAAMALFPTVKRDRLPRMADFARWGYAIAAALGEDGEQFLQEYQQNYGIQNTEAIEADPVASLTVEFMQHRTEWHGRVSNLHKQLLDLAYAQGISRCNKNLPTLPNALSRRLNGIKSNLQAMGITFTRTQKADGAYITLLNEKTPSFSTPHVDCPKFSGNNHGDNGGDISPEGKSSPCEIRWNGGATGDDEDDGDDFDNIDF